MVIVFLFLTLLWLYPYIVAEPHTPLLQSFSSTTPRQNRDWLSCVRFSHHGRLSFAPLNYCVEVFLLFFGLGMPLFRSVNLAQSIEPSGSVNSSENSLTNLFLALL